MSKQKFDLERAKVEGAITSDGSKARILCDDLDNRKHCIVVGITYKNGEGTCHYTKEGIWCGCSARMNLINLPRKQYGYVAIQSGSYVSGGPFDTQYDRNNSISSCESRGYTIVHTFEVDTE